MAVDLNSFSADEPVELIFLGTGSSECVPHVDCLTAPPEVKPCRTCLSTLRPEGKKNVRRNTSVVVRIRGQDGEKKTIVIDVGKTFQAAALEWFPKYGLRRIDAVLITHAHADAMNGLDDLRAWTLHGAIQPHVDLYVSRHTFTEVQRSFPYLVSKEYASGGGDVPEFKWHIIEDRVPFEIENTGINITPFAVHHGRFFSTMPPPEFYPTPNSTAPPSPPGTSESSSPVIPDSPRELSVVTEPVETIQPYLCLGFVIGNAVVYLSDCSYIPEDIWSIFNRSPDADQNTPVPPVFVLDCLGLRTHSSHLGMAQSVEVARRMGAQRTYLTGFGHDVMHEEYVTITEAVGGKAKHGGALTGAEKEGFDIIPEGKALWVRPAFDGLRVFVSEGLKVGDDEYH